MSEKSEKQGLRLRIALVVLAALALGYAGFELGRSSAGYFVAGAVIERLDSGKAHQALEAENKALRHRATVAEVGQRVDRQRSGRAA
jgi:NOL1/NOP2/fmu family ribosome biogenesis protein